MANQSPIELRCPKCAGGMLTYERSGIHVDQCRECRGVFLDRGELERLIDLESEAMGPRVGAGGGRAEPPGRFDFPLQRPYDDPDFRRGRGRGRDWDDDDDDWDDRPRSRRSFLGNLFDLD